MKPVQDGAAESAIVIDDIVAAVLIALDARKPSDEAEVLEVLDAADVQEIEVPAPAVLVEPNWELLDLALRGLAGLTKEAVEAMLPDVFVGPGRTFPVQDASGAETARAVIEAAHLGEEATAHLTKIIDEKVASFAAPEVVLDAQLKERYEAVLADYKMALKTIAELKEGRVDENVDENLDTDLETRDNMNIAEVIAVSDGVSNPSITGGGAPASKIEDLGAFERQIVQRYRTVQDKQGESHARQFLFEQMRKGVLPRNFQIEKYL